MAVFVALGAFLMTLAGGWTAQRVTDRRHLVLGLAGGLMLGVVGFDLLPEALAVAGREVFGVPAALLLFVAGFLLAHLVERLLAARRAAHGATERPAPATARPNDPTRPHGPRDSPAPAPTPDGESDDAGPPGRSGAPATDRAGGGVQPLDPPGSALSDRAPATDRAGGDAQPLGTVSGVSSQTVAPPHPHDHRSPEVGLTAAGAMVGHSAMDGVAIGAAFQVDGGMGVAVALAVIAHDFADGFNTFTLTSLYGNARRRALAMLFADACAPLAGALSTALFTIPEQALGGYLGLFGGVLLYLAAAEILPEAHHQHPARSTVLCTVAGAAFIWLVVGVAG